jgi:hypothetical protein
MLQWPQPTVKALAKSKSGLADGANRRSSW